MAKLTETFAVVKADFKAVNALTEVRAAIPDLNKAGTGIRDEGFWDILLEYLTPGLKVKVVKAFKAGQYEVSWIKVSFEPDGSCAFSTLVPTSMLEKA